MKTLFFATGNSRKVGEAQLACDTFSIKVEQVHATINEIQAHDPVLISQQKARDAFAQFGQPVVINDSFWSIPALQGFPGGYMKDVAEWFTAADFLRLMNNQSDRRIVVTECVIYTDATQTKTITKSFEGTIGTTAKGEGNSIEQVAVFNGLTLAEHHDKGQFSHGPKDYVWHDFAQWYAAQP